MWLSLQLKLRSYEVLIELGASALNIQMNEHQSNQAWYLFRQELYIIIVISWEIDMFLVITLCG